MKHDLWRFALWQSGRTLDADAPHVDAVIGKIRLAQTPLITLVECSSVWTARGLNNSPMPYENLELSVNSKTRTLRIIIRQAAYKVRVCI